MESRFGCRVPGFDGGGGVVRRAESVAQPVLEATEAASHLSQQEFARLVKSSQSRVAKMEKGDPSVSIDLLIKSLLVLGTTRREIAKAIA